MLWARANDFAGHEVKADILKVEHVERSLLIAVCQLITLVAIVSNADGQTGMANKEANKINGGVDGSRRRDDPTWITQNRS